MTKLLDEMCCFCALTLFCGCYGFLEAEGAFSVGTACVVKENTQKTPQNFSFTLVLSKHTRTTKALRIQPHAKRALPGYHRTQVGGDEE